MIRQFPAPTFGHAAEAFVIAHAAPGAWADGTAVNYRQTLTAIDGKLAASGPSAAADVAVLATPDWGRRAGGRVHRRVRRPRPGDPRPAPVRAAVGHRLVD